MPRDNVLVVEDDGSSLAFIEVLQEFEGFTIYKTVSWSDAEVWLKDEPGEDSFAALIFDLHTPSYELKVYEGTPYRKETDFYPSLYFFDHFIKKQTQLQNRVILYSAYLDDLKKMRQNLDEFITVSKKEDGCVKKLIAIVDNLRE